MKLPSQDLKDRILWQLANHDGKMKRSRLRRQLYTTLAELEPMLQELEKEGKIGRSDIKKRGPNEIITLRGDYFHKGREINF